MSATDPESAEPAAAESATGSAASQPKGSGGDSQPSPAPAITPPVATAAESAPDDDDVGEDEPPIAAGLSTDFQEASLSSHDGGHDGTGEGPPPGTRLEGALATLIGLMMVVLPVMGSLRRIADALLDSTRLPWLTHLLGRGLGFLIPKDMTWGAVYTQIGTLWIGFLGAVLATAGGKHLGLATTNFMPKGRLRSAAEGFSAALAAVVCTVLVYGNARMVASDRAGGALDALPGGLPKWVAEMIMPLAFAVMAARATSRALHPGRSTATRGQRIRRIVIVGLVSLVAAAALYIGFRADSSPAIQEHLSKLDAERTRHLVRAVSVPLLILGFLIGTPVFVVMAGMAMALFFADGTPVASLPSETFRLISNPSLPAVPLLTIAGYALATGHASGRLVRAFKSVFGWLPGGLSLMVVMVCAIFTTFTGGSGVTILALGGLVLPMLRRDHYPKGFSLGLVTAAGSLGLLFFPSLPVVLYSVAASAPGSAAPVSADDLYRGGLAPGMFMILLVCLYGIWHGVRARAPRQAFSWVEARSAIIAAKWDLGLPVLVYVAFKTGVATVVETAALAAAYVLIVELLVHRDIHPTRQLPGAMAHAAGLVGAVVVLLGVALGLTNYLVEAEVPTKLVEWVRAHVHSRWVFLLLLNVGLLVLGSVLEIYSAIIVLVPLVAPLGAAFGVHPVHLGVIFLSNLELGFLCPPMGLNLFLSATRFQKPLPVLYREALPFLGIMGIAVLVITYIPAVTMSSVAVSLGGLAMLGVVALVFLVLRVVRSGRKQ